MNLNTTHKLSKTSKSSFFLSFIFVLLFFIQNSYSQTREIQLVNQTGFPIIEVYIAAPENEDWGFNLIEGYQLAPSNIAYSLIMDTDSCIFDLKVVLSNEVEIEFTEIDFCYDPVFYIE